MRFEWNEAKRKENLRKHGIDFADLPPLFDGVTVTILDDRCDYGEDRFLTVGILHGIVVVVAHTETQEVIRLISARRGTRDEENLYFKEVGDELDEAQEDEG